MIKALSELHGLQRGFDALSEVLEQVLGTSICIRNCGRCCQVNTPMMSIIEGINLVSTFMLEEQRIKRIVEKCEEWLLEKHNLTIFDGIPVGPQAGKLMDEVAQTSRMQCPLLLENNDCLIHLDRPLTCRAFGVFRDAADICPRPLGKGETHIKHAIIDGGRMRPLVNEYFEGLKERQPEWAIRTFVPTAIFRAASPETFRQYADEKKIASAKLFGMDFDTSLMWQPQLDDLRGGMTPDQVMFKETISGIAP